MMESAYQSGIVSQRSRNDFSPGKAVAKIQTLWSFKYLYYQQRLPPYKKFQACTQLSIYIQINYKWLQAEKFQGLSRNGPQSPN